MEILHGKDRIDFSYFLVVAMCWVRIDLWKAEQLLTKYEVSQKKWWSSAAALIFSECIKQHILPTQIITSTEIGMTRC